MKTNVEISGKGKDTVIRHYNDKHEILAYADKNYAFTCERTESGEMVNYQNSDGSKL